MRNNMMTILQIQAKCSNWNICCEVALKRLNIKYANALSAVHAIIYQTVYVFWRWANKLSWCSGGLNQWQGNHAC